jgi:hypothetical protein
MSSSRSRSRSRSRSSISSARRVGRERGGREGRERGREGGREGGKEGGREGGREGGIERVGEGVREGGREGRRCCRRPRLTVSRRRQHRRCALDAMAGIDGDSKGELLRKARQARRVSITENFNAAQQHTTHAHVTNRFNFHVRLRWNEIAKARKDYAESSSVQLQKCKTIVCMIRGLTSASAVIN